MDANTATDGMPQGAERRRYKRFPCEGHAEVVCCHPAFLFRGKIRDISLTGCFIETAAPLRVERMTEVELRFTTNGHHLRSMARIMAIRPGKGAGFEFLPGDTGAREPFLQLIETLDDGSEASPQPH